MTRWLLVGLAAFAGYALLPSVASMVGGVADLLVSELEAVMPRLAIAAGLVGVVSLILPFTRHHAPGLIKACFYVAAGAIVIPVAVTWAEAHTGVLTTAVLGVGNTMVVHLTSALSSAGG